MPADEAVSDQSLSTSLRARASSEISEEAGDAGGSARGDIVSGDSDRGVSTGCAGGDMAEILEEKER